jgi:hypothetical protein
MRTASLLLLASMLVPQAREASSPPPAQGTATLSGMVVTDDATGAPVRRALITVLMTADSRRQFQVATDERGRFTVSSLPRGNATVIASKPAYVTTYYGAKQPGSTMGVPVALSEGNETTINIRLPRGAVVMGTVLDERGQPMRSVGVRVRRLITSASGQRQMVSPTVSALISSTDDRGAYRIFGLPAGDYVVSALPRLSGGGEIRPSTVDELQWAERQIRPGGSGSIGPPTAPPPPSGRSVTYTTVYHPSVVDVATAGVISLSAGQERAGVDLRMQFVTTARIQGLVTQPGGQPAIGMQVLLVPKNDVADSDAARLAGLADVGLLGSLARTGPGGTFELLGVEPGDYFLLTGHLATGRAGVVSALSANMLWGMAEVRVEGRDVTGVSLRLAPGQNLSGRVVFEGNSAPSLPARISLSLRATERTGFSITAPLSVAASEPFAVPGVVPSTYRLNATMTGWIMKSARIGDRDVTNAIFEVKPGEDLSNLVVTFSDAPSEVTGVLYDAANRPSSDLSMVLFSTSPDLWFDGSRHTRPPVRPASDGRFTFSGLAPGDYFLAALTDVSPGDLANPQFLEQVAASAIKVSVSLGEKKIQDLKIAR